MTPTLTWKQILAFIPRDIAPVRKLIKAQFSDYKTRSFTLADAHEAGVAFDDLVWMAANADPRRERLFAADCAARVSHLMTDARSHEAIRCARLFARGHIGEAERDAARAAAWDAAADAARDAARDAAWGAARDAAWGAARGAARDAAWGAERAWQTRRLLEWFSDHEPEDWPTDESGLRRESK